MIKLYESIDATFINLWNEVRSPADPSWIRELRSRFVELGPDHFRCDEEQNIDVLVIQHWLRTIIWQLSFAQGLLATPAANSMLFLSPNRNAMDLQVAPERYLQSAKQPLRASLVSLVAHNIRFFVITSFPMHPV